MSRSRICCGFKPWAIARVTDSRVIFRTDAPGPLPPGPDRSQKGASSASAAVLRPMTTTLKSGCTTTFDPSPAAAPGSSGIGPNPK